MILTWNVCMQAMRVYSAFGVAGWLAIYFAKVSIILLLRISELLLAV